MNSEVFNGVLEWVKNSKLYWQVVPSNNSDPEFVNTFQFVLSNIGFKREISHKEVMANNIFMRNNEKIKPILKEIDNQLNTNNIFAKLAVWKVSLGGTVKEHKDIFDYHKQINRYLVNLNIDKESSKFTVDNQILDLPIGKITYFDHTLNHSFNNGQNEDVYFLQIDILKNVEGLEKLNDILFK